VPISVIDCTKTRALTAIVLALGAALAGVSTASGHAARSSAESKWIVFTAESRGSRVDQIFRIQPSGKGLKQLTRGNTYPSQAPAFSPNGKKIAFTRLGVGIFTMNPDGRGLRQLTANGRDSFPAWSPDGKKIAFLRPEATGWKVYVMSASGAGERRLPQAPASAGRPSWTSHGLLVPTMGDLARIDPKTGRLQKLFGALIDASTGVDATSVSPDLSAVTFVGPRKPDTGDKECGENIACARYALYIQDLAKHKAPRILLKDAGPASFSADGKSAAFVAKNRIVLWTVKNGKSTSIKTGNVNPATSSPPVFQPG
jgi:Tol biopolymer transport system component